MFNSLRIIYYRGLNKGFGAKAERCIGRNIENKDGENSPNVPDDKNY